MKNLLTYFLLFFTLTLSAQNIQKLDEDNGFADIKILSDLDTISDFISIFKDPDIDNSKYEFAMIGCTHTYNGTAYNNFGNTAIKKIFLRTSGGYITEIKVICEHDSSVIETLKQMYGEPTFPFTLVEDFENKKAAWGLCIWQGRNVRLLFTAKKYYKQEDNEKADVPNYMYLKITSLKGENFNKQ